MTTFLKKSCVLVKMMFFFFRTCFFFFPPSEIECVCVAQTFPGEKKTYADANFLGKKTKHINNFFLTTFTLVYGGKFTFLGGGLDSGEWSVENNIFITLYEGNFIFRISGFFSG